MKKLALSLAFALGATLSINAELYIVGAMTGWDTAKAQEMTETETNVYEWTGNFAAGNDFKFLTGRSWDQCWTSEWEGLQEPTKEYVVSGQQYQLYYKSANTGVDSKFYMTDAGRYKVVVDLNTQKMVCTLDEGAVIFPDLYITGGALPQLNWSNNPGDNYKLKQNGTEYTITTFLTGKNFTEESPNNSRFIFLPSVPSWDPRFLPATGQNVALTGVVAGTPYEIKQESNMGSAGFVVQTPGVYNITINLNDDAVSGTMTLEQTDLCVIGPAVSNGNWEFGDISKYQFDILENGNYTITHDFEAGDARINVKGEWAPCFAGVDGTPEISADGGEFDLKWSIGNANITFAEAGNYTLLIDFNAEGVNPKLIVTRNEDVEEVPLTELYIVGNALNGKEGAWNLNEEYVQPMTATDNPGEFTWTGQLYKDGQFKFLYNKGSWDGLKAGNVSENTEIASGNTYALTDANDYKFIIPENGMYTVTAKTYGDDKTMTIVNSNGEELGVGEVASATGISVNGREITAEGAARIYDIAGRTVADFSNATVTVPAGLYIVVSEGKALRILVK